MSGGGQTADQGCKRSVTGWKKRRDGRQSRNMEGVLCPGARTVTEGRGDARAARAVTASPAHCFAGRQVAPALYAFFSAAYLRRAQVAGAGERGQGVRLAAAQRKQAGAGCVSPAPSPPHGACPQHASTAHARATSWQQSSHGVDLRLVVLLQRRALELEGGRQEVVLCRGAMEEQAADEWARQGSASAPPPTRSLHCLNLPPPAAILCPSSPQPLVSAPTENWLLGFSM